MIDEIKSSRINYKIKKNQMDFKPKLSNIRIRSIKRSQTGEWNKKYYESLWCTRK